MIPGIRKGDCGKMKTIPGEYAGMRTRKMRYKMIFSFALCFLLAFTVPGRYHHVLAAPLEDCDLDGYDDATGVPVPWPGYDETKGDTPDGPGGSKTPAVTPGSTDSTTAGNTNSGATGKAAEDGSDKTNNVKAYNSKNTKSGKTDSTKSDRSNSSTGISGSVNSGKAGSTGTNKADSTKSDSTVKTESGKASSTGANKAGGTESDSTGKKESGNINSTGINKTDSAVSGNAATGGSSKTESGSTEPDSTKFDNTDSVALNETDDSATGTTDNSVSGELSSQGGGSQGTNGQAEADTASSGTVSSSVATEEPEAVLDTKGSLSISEATGSRIHAGSPLIISGSGFAGNIQNLEIVIQSETIQLGTVDSTEAGAFEGQFNIPKELAAGVHHIAVLYEGKEIINQQIEVGPKAADSFLQAISVGFTKDNKGLVPGLLILSGLFLSGIGVLGFNILLHSRQVKN